jgi:hypothetical protein
METDKGTPAHRQAEAAKTAPVPPPEAGKGAHASDADKAAADRRKADLQGAADSLAARRKAEDEGIAQRRVTEDEGLADARTEEDRVVASTRHRLAVAAAAMTTGVQNVSNGGDPAQLRVADAELQAAVQDHLNTVPEVIITTDK